MIALRILDTYLLGNYTDIMEAKEKKEELGYAEEPEPEWVRYSFNLFCVESCVENDEMFKGTKVYFEDGTAALIKLTYPEFLNLWKGAQYQFN